MFEAILQEGETIVMQDVGAYCGDGKTAAIKEGMFVLTNKRLLVLKNKSGGGTASLISTIVVVGIVIGVPQATGIRLSVIEAAIMGGIAGAVASLVSSKLFKGKAKPAKVEDVVHAFALEDIKEISNATRGITRDMIGVTTSSGLCKIKPKDNLDAWRNALNKQQ